MNYRYSRAYRIDASFLCPKTLTKYIHYGVFSVSWPPRVVTKVGSCPILRFGTGRDRVFGDLNDIVFSVLNGKFYNVTALASRAFLLEAIQAVHGLSELRPPFARGNGFFPTSIVTRCP